jgi:hypothetical protein
MERDFAVAQDAPKEGSWPRNGPESGECWFDKAPRLHHRPIVRCRNAICAGASPGEAAPLRGAANGDLRTAAENLDRQNPEIRAARTAKESV